jgi:hypothetical protein
VAEVTGQQQAVSVITPQLLAMPAPAAMAVFAQMREVLRTQILQEAFRLDRRKYKKLRIVSDELSEAEYDDHRRLVTTGDDKARGVVIKYNQLLDDWYASPSPQHGNRSNGWTS